ncbi:MAG: HDIG domain-containing metalloprotein, partial [bacterium]
HESFRTVNLTSFYYVIPFASAPMLSAMLQGRSAAVLMAVASAAMAGILLPEQVHFSMVALAGGVMAAIRWKDYRRRSAILLAGLMVGLLSLALALGFNMQEGLRTATERWPDLPMALLGGIATMIVVSAALPLFESMFKLTTDMRLLELADQNHPLLRQLVVQVPGTYHHSLLVGNLAEEAAESIGANPLLTRVGAYFHDIGKILKPEYFIENQGAVNRHDRLNPSMSALILISHVKEGVEMGRSHKLPKEIINLIKQHHGTTLIRFFYDKAQKAGGDGAEIPEEAYRYPGPRPQTREAGILMLADMVEATSRTLQDPSPARLAGMVERAVQMAFADGQFDECDLTLRDLGGIQESFLRVLAGMYHHRVGYPDPKTSERKGSGESVHIKPAKAGAARSPGLAPAGRGGPRGAPVEG